MNDNNRLIVNMEVEEPLHDIVTDEFTSVVFECKVSDCSRRCISCKWYKDGKQIEDSRRIKMSYDGKWHRLEITSVTYKDYGVYIIMLHSDCNKIFSKANLYVREIKDKHYNDVLYINPKPRRFHAIRHLKDAKVLVGDTIELEATFNSDILDDFLWYKSNRPLLLNERMIILNDKRMTTLSILCAKETDTGIYHVVCKSEFGVASSFASVMVINTDLVTLNTSEVAPSIDEPLPEELEVNEGEEARLMCKVTYDVNTIIQWSKNGIQLEENNNVATEYYNNRYTCLRIKNTCMKDAGEYTILMRDEITGHTDTSTCFLTINHSPTDTLNSVKLRTPLQPIITCVGSKLSFNCSFILDDPKFYYVVWYIGHYRVERTNHRFQVICSGGDFFLFIKQIEPGMSGEITCELRMALPTRKSLVINSTSTNLTIVPSAVIDEVVKLNNITAGRNVYNIENSKLNIPVKNTKHFSNGIQKPKISTNGTKVHKEEMVITYCRLDDDNFYFDITNSDDEIKYFDFVSLYENCIFYEPSKSKSNVVIMEWCNTIANNIDFNESKKKWYKYEFKKTSDDFVEVGVSSIPMLEVKDPPLEQIMKFRITVVTEAVHNPNESRVCISPDVEELEKINKQCELKPMEEFNSIFTKTGDLIGCGAFGSVVLVRDNDGEFYAAKILKTRTQKKRDTAIREYEMMKRLRHPKLVELHSTFTAKESFILVMDYLWGGELFDRIVDEEHIKELDVVPYVRQICEALQYLHGYKIVHLDLKPENIICLSPNSRQVKIIDFGLARVLDESQMRAIYGTRDYVAPEVLNFEQLTLACDMWSLGVVTYMLLSGVMPFSGDSWPERSANITKAKYNYHESAFKDISDLAKDFVDHLLILQPEKRMKASDALNHRWIVEGPPKGAKAGHMKRTRQNLKSYLANNRARWQRAGNVMIAAHRLRNAGSQRNTLDADRMSPRVT